MKNKMFFCIIFFVALLLNIETNLNGRLYLGSNLFASTGTSTDSGTSTSTKIQKWFEEDINCTTTCWNGEIKIYATTIGCYDGTKKSCSAGERCSDIETPKDTCPPKVIGT